MKKWHEYLSEKNTDLKNLKNKDRVSIYCFDCDKIRTLSVGGVKQGVVRSGEGGRPFCCQSCGARRGRTEEAMEQQRATNLKKYGVENAMQSHKIMEKLKKTNLERYGCENVFSCSGVQTKIRSTNLELYGHENPSQNPDIQKKKEITHTQNWGKPHLLQVLELREKVLKSNQLKYGGIHKKQGELFRNNNVLTERDLCVKLVKYLRKTKGACNAPDTLAFMHTTTGTTLTRLLYKFGLEKFLSQTSISCGERELHRFILSLGIPEEWVEIQNNTALGGRLQIDIFIPTLKIGFEYNGNFWHSEAASHQKKRHLEKRVIAEKLGIFLIQIRSDEWEVKRGIVESMVKHILIRRMEEFLQ